MCKLITSIVLSLLLSIVLCAQSTTTTITSTPNPTSPGQNVTVTATVTSGGNPVTVGRINFFVDGVLRAFFPPNSSGQASLGILDLSVGSHNLQAAYDPRTSSFQPSSSPIIIHIVKAPTTTSIISNNNPTECTQSVTLSATVTSTFAGTITGTVQFKDNGSPIGDAIALISGTAGVTTAPLSIGNHAITAEYSGNSSFAGSTGALTQNVQDLTPPSITAPSPVTAFIGPGATSCAVTVSDGTLGTPTASDNCSGVTITRTGVPAANLFPVGSTTITYTATDGGGNTATATQAVTVRDTISPSIVCPTNVVASVDSGKCNAVVNFSVSATDNCSGATVVSTPASGSAFPVGTTTVNCTATDVAGNSATCSFNVTVNDNRPPTIFVSVKPASLWPPDNKLRTISATVTASDNCPGATYVLTSITSSESGGGPDDIQGASYGTPDPSFELRAARLGKGGGRVYTVTYTATDPSGNSASASGTVTVPHDERNKVSSIEMSLPDQFALFQNHPNPFNPTTGIRFDLPTPAVVTLGVYNVFGQEVARLIDGEYREAGRYDVRFDGSRLGSGVYFYRITAGAFSEAKKMVLMK